MRAVVTGGSRGVGRGIAQGLAESGAEVWFTGRDADRLTETASALTALGAAAHPRSVDHRDDAAVDAFFAEVRSRGPIDVLVNSVWGGYDDMVDASGNFTWPAPLWQQPRSRWDSMFVDGVRAAVVACQCALPAMVERRAGLVVNVSYWAARTYVGNTLYGMAKAATDKLTADLAVELAPHEVQVVSLYPGLVRTDRVLENAAFLDLTNSESPQFSGRVVAALARDRALAAHYSGSVVVGAEFARARGIVDIDGASPEPMDADHA